MAIDLKGERQKVLDLSETLWTVLTRFKEPASEDLSIHLPPGTTLSVCMDQEVGIPSGFTLATPYATLSITISRFWSNSSLASKTGCIVLRLAGKLPGQYEILRRIEKGAAEPWIGRIPVVVSIRFRPYWVFSKQAERTYAWVAECIEHLRDRLAWSSVLEGETERLLVELHEKIEGFGENSLPRETR